MHSFTDNACRTWCVAINVAAIKRVRGLLDIDLYQLVDDGLKQLGKLVSDPVQLVDVLYVLCREEAIARGVSDEDFGRALAGDAITLAAEAFVEELIDFFPDARSRAGLRKVIEAGRQVREKLLDHVETQLQQLDVNQAVHNLIASWTNSPASSASTPDPARSVNSS